MTDDESRRGNKAGFRDAPDVGAFYFEDAAETLARSGYHIGRVEFTLPPRQQSEAAALAKDIAKLPVKNCRVIRCVVSGANTSGEPICDMLLTVEKGMLSGDD